MCNGLLLLCFSRSFWMRCTPTSFLVCSVGCRRMNSAASNFRSGAQIFGWWCGRGRGPHFEVSVLQCWADSAPIVYCRLRFSGKFWILLVQMYLLCHCMEVCKFWQRLLQAIWKVGTVLSSWSTPHLISSLWSVASGRLRRLYLGALTRFHWRNSW